MKIVVMTTLDKDGCISQEVFPFSRLDDAKSEAQDVLEDLGYVVDLSKNLQVLYEWNGQRSELQFDLTEDGKLVLKLFDVEASR